MTYRPIKKPFYLLPPWNILFEFHKLEKLTPWNISIAYLLTTFLREMEKTGQKARDEDLLGPTRGAHAPDRAGHG